MSSALPEMFVFAAGGRELPFDRSASRDWFQYGTSRGLVSSQSGFVSSEETWQELLARVREYGERARTRCDCRVGLRPGKGNLVPLAECEDMSLEETMQYLLAR